MKTINDIITRKNRYSDIVNPESGEVVLRGRKMSKNLTSSRTILSTETLENGVSIEKFQIVVCSYSKIKEYRRQQNGYKPVLSTRYRYTYEENGKRLTSRDFLSLDKLMVDMKKKTPSTIAEEVIITE